MFTRARSSFSTGNDPEHVRRRFRLGTGAGVLVKNEKTRRREDEKRGDRDTNLFFPQSSWGMYAHSKKRRMNSLPSSADCEYQESGVLCLMEMWWNGKTPGCAVELIGFLLVGMDRDKQSGKKLVVGLAAFLNNKWCNQRR